MAEYIKSITLPTSDGGNKELLVPYGPDLDSRFKKIEGNIDTLEEQIDSSYGERIATLEGEVAAAKEEATSALSMIKSIKKGLVEKAAETGDWSLCSAVCDTVGFTDVIPDNDIVIVKDDTRTLVLDGCRVLHAEGFDGIVSREPLDPSQSWKGQNKSNSIHQINVAESPIKLWQFATPPTKLSGLFYNGDGLPSKVTDEIAFVGLSTVTLMGYMFFNSEVKYIDCSHLDITNVRPNEISIYHGTHSIEAIDLSWLKGKKLTRASSLMSECHKVKSIDLSPLDISEAQDVSGLLSGFRSLESVDLSPLDTGKATNMRSMFSHCLTLQEIDVSPLNTSCATDMGFMFNMHRGENNQLRHIRGLSNFNMSNVTCIEDMFQGCDMLEELDVNAWDTSNITTMEFTFNHCKSLKSLDLSNWNTESVTNCNYMVQDCTVLEKLDLSSAKWPNLEGFYNVLNVTENIKTMRFGGIGTSEHVTNWNFYTQSQWGTAGEESRASLIDTLLTLSADRSDKTPHKIVLSRQTKAVLTPEEIAAVTARGYTIV